MVTGDYKPGRVTNAVTDLAVPAPGIPIAISRTCDIQEPGTSSDFAADVQGVQRVERASVNHGRVGERADVQLRHELLAGKGDGHAWDAG